MGAKWKPLKIEFEMVSPIALNHPWLHFDGILGHLLARRAYGRDYYMLPTKESVTTNLPSRWAHILGIALGEIPCASISFFEPNRLYSLQYFKRTEIAGFPGKRKLDTASGHFRHWMLRTVYVPAQTCTFYAKGDPKRIGDLLQELTAIGNDTRVGWGKIRSVRIQEIDRDRSIINEDGIAMRPIPVRLLSDCEDEVPLAWRPPYWDPSHVEPCAPPGTRVRLKR